MGNRLRRFALLCFALCLIVATAGRVNATDELEETRSLLQKGLTIHELDREIAGLSVKELQITMKIVENQERLKEKDQQVQQTREHVKHVLRAYYNGGRKPVWAMLLSANSWKDALYVLEQTQIIANNDKRSIDRYMSAYKEMKTATEQLEATRTELSDLKAHFLAQKDEAVKLQEELDAKLAALPVGNIVSNQIDDLTKQWEAKGLPQVRLYFSSLASTMQKLPELIAQRPDMLVLKGRSYSFQLKDTEFNDFIHAKSKDLETLSFTFEDGRITVQGKQGDTDMTIVGRYELAEQPENSINFHIDELSYNGLKLPPGTVNELKETNDLSFYPSKIAGYLSATSAKTTPGKLTIDLKLTF